MKILLIEDDPFFQKLYLYKLKEQNIQIEIAADGEEGLSKIHSFKPDVVLLDLILPKKDGFSILETRLKDESLKKIPVIIFSSLGQEKDKERAKKLGATDYMNKSSFNFAELMQKIANAIKIMQ